MTMKRPTTDAHFMQHAYVAAVMATCNRLQVGAVLVRDAAILSTGRNGAPIGLPHCRCGPSARCEVSVHAEVNAIVFAAVNRQTPVGATLYVTHAPCLGCSGALINSRIARVVFDTPYKSMDGVTRLHRAGIEVERLAAQREGREEV
jgi:dCMP deaminase